MILYQGQGSRFLYLSHNTLYRVQSEVKCNQIRSAQWTVQNNTNKNYVKVTQHKSIYMVKKEK